MSPLARPILLVEDDPRDLEFALEALSRADSRRPVEAVGDGVEVLERLQGEGRWADREVVTPAVVLLDLKMPRIDGLEVLARLKSDLVLRPIPVVMLTSSREERDVVESYRLGANAFVVKPLDFNAYLEAIRGLAHFWGALNEPSPLRA